MSNIYLARQPIFDKNYQLHGYELLYRDGDVPSASFESEELATSRLLLSSVIDIGLDKLIEEHQCFLNINADNLNDIENLPVDDNRITLEVNTPLEFTETQINSLKLLKSQGYKLAINDFRPDNMPASDLTCFDYLKCNSSELNHESLKAAKKIAKQNQCKAVATHIEFYEQITELTELGFDYYQGYFLSKPDTRKKTALPTTLLTVVQTLARILDPELEIEELNQLISSDVSLSYRVLKLLNSAQYNTVNEIDSIDHAIVYLGRDAIKNLSIIIILTGIDDKPSELTKLALIRAKMCEILARQFQMTNLSTYFAVGLLSVLDAMLDQTMSDVLNTIPLSEELKAALISHDGIKGQTLQCVLEYEECRLAKINFATLESSELTGYYLEATEWADETFKGLSL